MKEVLSLALRDFFTKKFLKFAFLPLFLSFILLAILAFFGFHFLLDYFDSLFASSDQSGVLAWIYSFAFVQILLVILSFLSASFIVVFASVFLAIFIVSFLTPLISKEINAKYYHHELRGEVSFFKALQKMLWIFCKFIFFFACASVLLLVPFVNLFIYYVVIYYLFHKLLILDVASSVLNKAEFEHFYLKTTPLEFKFATLCFYLLSSVPFFGLFLQVFYVIFLTHLFYQKVLDLKPLQTAQNQLS
ncbi:hypothetical protein DMB92_00045 [Campylobacter sp. MIT 99-7217]|uniref:EI24 domain-containing protein n=1 Tax=Campylobacter sp. MIT 99-7217 TaxID=535091 RepID=UPI00115B25C5|nr:EI24 domain-containing protein [Campylobacter sp. MIT 99-7217]TQR34397.1 hypothetical protein DMB92_00045 [Campylobacter sp. MIT 99-7217]